MIAADCFHLILKDHKILVLGALDHVCVDAVLREPLDLRVHRSSADTAGDEQDIHFPKLFVRLLRQFAGSSQRSDHVCKAVTLFQELHPIGACADDLENDGDGAFFPVIVADRQGNALPCLVDPDDQEFAGKTFLRDAVCLNFHQEDLFRQLTLFQNSVHDVSPQFITVSFLSQAPVCTDPDISLKSERKIEIGLLFAFRKKLP